MRPVTAWLDPPLEEPPTAAEVLDRRDPKRAAELSPLVWVPGVGYRPRTKFIPGESGEGDQKP